MDNVTFFLYKTEIVSEKKTEDIKKPKVQNLIRTSSFAFFVQKVLHSLFLPQVQQHQTSLLIISG